ncbi:hypothetical protein [Pseudoalteromonas umbrosa]|uniref:hypothetical protein n=1 Tax=Pseudoalteromonas umbrosa TaxID=3048489 RepID=UPI0024C3133F|nr:hypothetical protein [Pseudoalteromonas sp. B95]MDK1290058.1 hypothetical protein [Pseudoalteromonas sp. B95]
MTHYLAYSDEITALIRAQLQPELEGFIKTLSVDSPCVQGYFSEEGTPLIKSHLDNVGLEMLFGDQQQLEELIYDSVFRTAGSYLRQTEAGSDEVLVFLIDTSYKISTALSAQLSAPRTLH